MKYQTLGIGVYAFSDDAKNTVDELVTNKDKAEDLVYWTESESIALIKGPKNSGKTRLALEVIDNFKGEGKVIFIDLNTYNKEIDIGHLLIGNQPMHRKLLNQKPKEMILIVDNAHNLDTDFYKRLQYFYDQGYLKSVIFIQKSDEILDLPESIKSRIGNKIINLNKLSKDEYLQIANNRLNNFLNEQYLEHIWNHSKEFSSFLADCEKIATTYIEEGRKRLDLNFINKVLK